MNKPLIKFVRHYADLKPTSEMWVKESFAARKKDILEDFVRREDRLPSHKMSYVRKATFPINSDTSMEDLWVLSSKIKKQFGIDAFQIAIKRTAQCAYFLFDFYDRKMGGCYWLTIVEQRYLLVLIVRTLKLEESLIPDHLLRYYFLLEYKDNPNIFRQNMALLKQKGLGKKIYYFIRNSLKFTELVCNGILKGNSV